MVDALRHLQIKLTPFAAFVTCIADRIAIGLKNDRTVFMSAQNLGAGFLISLGHFLLAGPPNAARAG